VSLKASAILQGRSIYALLLHRVRSQHMGSRAGYLWAFVEPVCWVFVLRLALKNGGNTTPPIGESFEVFLATGITLARTWRTCAAQVAMIVVRRKRMALPSVFHSDLIIAVWLLEMITGLIVLIIILAVLGAFDFEVMPANILHCLAAYFALSVYTLAFALFFGLVITLAPGVRHFQQIILLALFMSSGFSFLVDRMPIRLREIVTWNPLVHCLEWFREGFYAGYECRSLDLNYLFGVTVVMMLLGMAGERAFRRKKEIRTDGEAEEF
jgi:capsular polysaccharide transport system permease protein